MSFESSIKCCGDRNASPISPKNKNDNDKIKGMIGRKSIWLGIDAGAWSQRRKKLKGELNITVEGVKRVFNYRAYLGTDFLSENFPQVFLKLFNPS